MKKITSVLSIIIIISILLCSCASNSSNVKAELVGTWAWESSSAYREFTFSSNGDYHSELVNFLGTQFYEGTYKIEKDSIVINDSEGDPFKLPYSYNSDSGKLTVWFNNSALTKIS